MRPHLQCQCRRYRFSHCLAPLWSRHVLLLLPQRYHADIFLHHGRRSLVSPASRSSLWLRVASEQGHGYLCSWPQIQHIPSTPSQFPGWSNIVAPHENCIFIYLPWSSTPFLSFFPPRTTHINLFPLFSQWYTCITFYTLFLLLHPNTTTLD